MIYLTQFLAKTKLGSRRQAEKLIKQKKVKVNNEIAYLGQKINGDEKIEINNKEISKQNLKNTDLILFNKPAGYTCTKRSFKGENNIYSLLPKKYNNYIIIGRLDKNSRGLLLLTNNGFLANKISHPKYAYEKKYLVRLANDKNLKQSKLFVKLKKGVKNEEGEILKLKNIYKENDAWLITLTEGKKRHIRKMFQIINILVTDLQRISIAKFELNNLKEGSFKVVKEENIRQFLS